MTQYIIYGHGLHSPILLNCDKKQLRKQVLRVTGYQTAKPIYCDTIEGASIKIGFYLSLRGNYPIWATVKECINPFKIKDELKEA